MVHLHLSVTTRQLRLCDLLLQLLCILSTVVLADGELGLKRTRLGDDRLHGQQVVDEILQTGRGWRCTMSEQQLVEEPCGELNPLNVKY